MNDSRGKMRSNKEKPWMEYFHIEFVDLNTAHCYFVKMECSNSYCFHLHSDKAGLKKCNARIELQKYVALILYTLNFLRI